MPNVWHVLPRPIHGLAPMEDVTDTVFRRIIASCGPPDVFFTEFIHTEIVLENRGDRPGVTPRLEHTDAERPLIAQLWGTEPEEFACAAARVAGMGFDGVDINMGCPVRKIRRKGACAALINDPALAAEIIAATKTGLLPVSVKTRIGYEHSRVDEWIGFLLTQELDALTVHGRTALQESDGPVDWDALSRVAALAHGMGVRTAILGNGDVGSRDEIDRRCAETGLDGVLVGRGVFADPFLFATDGRAGRFAAAPADEKVDLLLRHLRLYRAFWGDTRNYEILKKFYKIYLVGFDEAEELRDRLNHTRDYDQAEAVISSWSDGNR